VLDAAGEVARRSEYFHLVKRNRGQFNFLVWGYPTGTLAPYAEESLARCGMTLQLLHQGVPKPPLYLAAFDIATIPYTTWLGGNSKTPEGIMAPFCWNDEAAVQKLFTDLAKRHEVTRQHGVFVYSLGDETSRSVAVCRRTAPRLTGRTEGKLWKSRRIEQIVGHRRQELGRGRAIGPKDNEEENSLQRKNYPRWFDRQSFKSYNYLKYCQRYVRAFEAI